MAGPHGSTAPETCLRAGSFVPGADGSGFSLANLPYGVAAAKDGGTHLVVAIGGQALDLHVLAGTGLLDDLKFDPAIWQDSSLNGLLRYSPEDHAALRARLQFLLSRENEETRAPVEAALLEREGLDLLCPLAPGDFVDFYSSYHHAARSMKAIRPDAELHPNWTHMPVGYHSRTGTICASGQEIIRPHGQSFAKGAPRFTPSRALDFEAEIGFVMCGQTRQGTRIAASDFATHVFGLVLLNDWSARDFQGWESTPLGPFLAKSFATQVGAWIVPLAALDGARRRNRSQEDALSYLCHDEAFSYALDMEVALRSAAMRDSGIDAQTIARMDFAEMYWDGAQQLAHLTANGASTRPGDLYGSGTVSGPNEDGCGCLLEATKGGKDVIALPDGTARGWLQDGDEVIIGATAKGADGARLSFGTLTGRVAPAV